MKHKELVDFRKRKRAGGFRRRHLPIPADSQF